LEKKALEEDRGMVDVLDTIGRSVIQHGPQSDRVYGMKLDPEDMPEVLDEMESLARTEGYGKLFVKTWRSHLEELVARGYSSEAVVPHFFGPGEDALFMGKFLDPERADERRPERVAAVLRAAGEEQVAASDPADETIKPESRKKGVKTASAPPDSKLPASELTVRLAGSADAEALADCYRAVFASYPFPIDDPGHIRNEMEAGTRYFTVWDGKDLVAASSMEPGGAPGTVEMTDFATLPSHRGRGLATHLLSLMDRTAKETGVVVAYTIARALSFGMNITFARRGYLYAGTLVNNTQISGSIESMNVWYKVMEPTPTTTSRS